MFQKVNYSGDITAQYQLLAKQLDALLDGEMDSISNLSNASALLNQFLDNINWCGFYLMKNNELLLGPFQGLPACVHIPLGKGVCGTSASTRETLVVEDVNAFPGHIACDSASQSEIVVPLIVNGELYGVLDIDSPIKNRFSNDDQAGLEQFVNVLVRHIHL
ncbi:GAF domain-containing protein [Rummeliibacillus stabekisii]|uniref:GAF domain-containing protein n=1 Tax=Rummeliibacillus stabekisii TaxID=241244 RepID=A0A143HD49_9BACL|nr:GAF domain-containing protein [Rummeliibacillus stabekisii]AMW99622.1 GAF domain-containing protein [Rummeliibacillus stabekisii]